MSGKTLTASEVGITLAQKALLERGWSHEVLAQKTIPPARQGKLQGEPISTKTVQNFLKRKSVSVQSFQAICRTLEVDWEIVAGEKSSEVLSNEVKPENYATTSSNTSISISTNVIHNHGTVIPYVNGDVHL